MRETMGAIRACSTDSKVGVATGVETGFGGSATTVPLWARKGSKSTNGLSGAVLVSGTDCPALIGAISAKFSCALTMETASNVR